MSHHRQVEMMSSSLSLSLSFLFLFIQTFSSISEASVPPAHTFKYVNEGEFGPYIVEYRADYRVLDVFNSPFQLCFYNTSHGAFTLALRMGTVRSESLMRWVWEANRGKSVGENATLTFGTDGNLVLADADGSIAWQTGTANKGVVGLKLLPNGNMVLHDSKGKFIWQSFDHPTDTLLVGQSLKVGAATKLVSRKTAETNQDGPYSLELEAKRLAMYNNIAGNKKILYFASSDWITVSKGSLEYVRIESSPDSDEGYAYNLLLEYQVANSSTSGNRILVRPKYNATLTFLRLGIDGNLRLYTYYDKVDSGAWEVTYTLFSRDSNEGECQLPVRCFNFGLCEDNQCVACPLPNGLLGWNQSCKPLLVSSCSPKNFQYYRLEGVDHYMSKYSEADGPMSERDCGNKCTKECKCVGYFYHQDTKKCWIAFDLRTITKVNNATHVGYIKVVAVVTYTIPLTTCHEA
ncbi:unnamed protein product [Ilex paraguariensis]|uniref:Uncharacterized protein n=1 Tax=Ilex paraguariensis TaxID=185542 RepID=A0ABC8S3H4_9AQUA